MKAIFVERSLWIIGPMLILRDTSLPTDLAKLRAMLDAHMFGRDSRGLRDDAVRVAWQIDSMRPSRAR